MSNAFTNNIANHIAEIVIDKPPVNALDSQEWHALANIINELGANQDVRVIILRSEGRGFCAGVDIKELDQHPERIVSVNAGNYATFKAIHRCPVPVIVAVHGYVLGGGIGMTGAADIVLASHCASFALPEVDRGAMGGGAHLQRLFPVQKVRYMFFTGETVTAEQADRYGFIEKICAREELASEARLIAEKIAAKSPAMIRIAKEALNGIEDGDLEQKYRWEQGFTLEAYTVPDSAETRRAFVEKRDAEF
ncbi:enoyl-CoA hydratase family protein [Thalassotalea ponticola]|uniref:enoyl-CoA hydratase family protein n=1 Tax=Thalassotalea ponticola TaxID=1523392 RepID=UPI0025B45BB4|nr:enoyl-CoA hydratase family protein [Thalassotalea ponticola]MDN3653815.1 enoyl-CoA hydratase family protein [Thalassotalea ponticola]